MIKKLISYSRFSNVGYFVIIAAALFSSCEKEYSCEKCIETPTPGGNVSFYTVANCVNDKPVNLIVDNSLHLTVDVFSFVPDCSTPGITTVTLSPGTHTWEALCGGRTIAGGIIDVMPDTCQAEEIK